MTLVLTSLPTADHTVAPLIARLLSALAEKGVAYCHWKSNWQLQRWLSGEGDLDLLFSKTDARRAEEVLAALDFKPLLPAAGAERPGIRSFYGYDPEAERFIHVHAYYQLVLGHDLTENYRLPVETAFLDRPVLLHGVRVPDPALELIVFVIRTTLRFSLPEALLRKEKSDARRRELHWLRSRVEADGLREQLGRYFAWLDAGFFERCLAALERGAPLVEQATCARRLRSALAAHSLRSETAALAVAAGRVVRKVLIRLLPGARQGRKRFARSGTIIAIVGGDGAGKSTAVCELNRWLGKNFESHRLHLGRPPRSLTRTAVRAAIRLGKSCAGRGPAAESRLRWLVALQSALLARDRIRLYSRARRLAANGAAVICDRFPLPELTQMDGVRLGDRRATGSRWEQGLARYEELCYRRIVRPDVLIVLRVDPEIAVARRIEEDPAPVRRRASEVWETDWITLDARVVDAGASREVVLRQLKSIVWSHL
jgi:thymidylate kinase